MSYFALIFIPPIYFLSRKQWGSFVVNSLFYGIACLCVLSIIGIMVAPIFWAFSVGHALFAYKKEARERQADRIATKMAEKLRENPNA